MEIGDGQMEMEMERCQMHGDGIRRIRPSGMVPVDAGRGDGADCDGVKPK